MQKKIGIEKEIEIFLVPIFRKVKDTYFLTKETFLIWIQNDLKKITMKQILIEKEINILLKVFFVLQEELLYLHKELFLLLQKEIHLIMDLIF